MAAEKAGDRRRYKVNQTKGNLTMTSYRIWYMRPDFFSHGLCGADWLERIGMLPDPEDLAKTHVAVTSIEAPSLEAVYDRMQGENWSPNGEARALLDAKGLDHTSMSTGDIAVFAEDGVDHVMIVDRIGFREIGPGVLVD